jgi:hypothetical protein
VYPPRPQAAKQDTNVPTNPPGVSLTVPAAALDMRILQREIAYFHNHIMILNFVEPIFPN